MTSKTPERLPPLLASEFCADHWGDVPKDIIYGTYDAAMRVLADPAKFPKADFDHLEKIANALAVRVSIMRFEDRIN